LEKDVEILIDLEFRPGKQHLRFRLWHSTK